MRIQGIPDVLGLGGVLLKAKNSNERQCARELSEMRAFDNGTYDQLANFSRFIEQFSGGMWGFTSETIMQKSSERVETSQVSLVETVRTFDEQVARVGLAAAEVAEEKYRAKLRELEEQLKKMEQRHEALTEGPEALAEEG